MCALMMSPKPRFWRVFVVEVEDAMPPVMAMGIEDTKVDRAIKVNILDLINSTLDL